MVDYAWEPWPSQFVDKPLDDSEPATPDPQKTTVKTARNTTSPPKKVIRPAGSRAATKPASPASPAKSG